MRTRRRRRRPLGPRDQDHRAERASAGASAASSGLTGPRRPPRQEGEIGDDSFALLPDVAERLRDIVLERAPADRGGALRPLSATSHRWVTVRTEEKRAAIAGAQKCPLVTQSRLARRFPQGGLLRSAVVTARALKDVAVVL
jgi:hypothetical protein